MASETVGRVALMSIHPIYARKILDGTKRVEFRKRPIGPDVTHVLIYATAPVSQIIGVFTVREQISMSPADLWSSFKDEAGIRRRDLMTYYQGHTRGTGICVEDAFTAVTPLDLYEDLGIQHPPQSFRYICPELAQVVLNQVSTAKAGAVRTPSALVPT